MNAVNYVELQVAENIKTMKAINWIADAEIYSNIKLQMRSMMPRTSATREL
jgi:hypothetical protein